MMLMTKQQTRNNRSWQSKISNELGHQLEMLILLGCQYYKQKDIAEVGQIPEPFRVTNTRRDGTFEARFTGNAQPDFQGTLNNGRSIVFEAKATRNKDRVIKQSVISDNQEKCLQSHYEMGALTGVCVQIHNTVAFVPWETWSQMKVLYGRKYMSEKEIETFKVETPGHIAFLSNYLKGVEF